MLLSSKYISQVPYPHLVVALVATSSAPQQVKVPVAAAHARAFAVQARLLLQAADDGLAGSFARTSVEFPRPDHSFDL